MPQYLTDTAIKNAKPKDKPWKLNDGSGLYVWVKPDGGKFWRCDYAFNRKRNTLSFGAYPEVSLKDARSRHSEAKAQIKAGIDPSMQRKAEAIRAVSAESFEAVALEWHKKQAEGWSTGYAERILNLLKHDLFPYLGAMPINAIEAPTLLAALKRMEHRGVRETTHRAREQAGAIFRYGIATGRCISNPSDALKGALAVIPVKHRAAVIDPKRFGQLIRDIDGYQGGFVTLIALKLSPLLALRPGELRHLEWSEVHLDTAEIRIRGAKMKMKSDHIVPLAKQSRALLEAIKPYSGNGRYVFPSTRTPNGDRPMSENTVTVALRVMGWDSKEVCAHGFRGSFCSIANERLNFSVDAIERQLAHAERNKVRSAYLHADFLDERRKLMQAWADYIDELRSYSTNVVPIKHQSNG